MEKILITGVAGTGKTALGRALRRKGINTIDMDDVPGLCGWRNKITGEKIEYEGVIDKFFIDSHDWICDVGHLIKLLDAQRDTAVAVGVASNQLELLYCFDRILLLQCKPETFIKRVAVRSKNGFGNDKTAQEFLISFYQPFEDDLLKKGAVPINADEPLNRVVRAVMREIHVHPTGSATNMWNRRAKIPTGIKRFFTSMAHSSLE